MGNSYRRSSWLAFVGQHRRLIPAQLASVDRAVIAQAGVWGLPMKRSLRLP
jgi:hypothetical protein